VGGATAARTGDNARVSIKKLQDALDGADPEGFDGADPEGLARLAEAITLARARHRRELAEATDQALSHVPRLLRGPVRRVIGL
jgi:hypothetical protein